MDKVGLSPPWYTLQNQFKYTIGLDSSVTVKDLQPIPKQQDCYLLEIIVRDDNIACALREIIKPVFLIGNTKVVASIKNSKGQIVRMQRKSYSDVEIKNLFCTAFKNNPLFVDSISKVVPLLNSVVFVIFKKEIIQFFNDDLTDICQNYNGIAANIFGLLCFRKFNKTIVNFNTKGNCTKDISCNN